MKSTHRRRDRTDNRLERIALKAILADDLLNLVDLSFAQVIDLMVLLLLFRGVMLCIRARSEIPTKAHRGRAGDNFGQSGSDHHVRVGKGRGKARHHRERDREAIRHPHHDVADAFRGGEVLLDMRGGCTGRSWLRFGLEESCL